MASLWGGCFSVQVVAYPLRSKKGAACLVKIWYGRELHTRPGHFLRVLFVILFFGRTWHLHRAVRQWLTFTKRCQTGSCFMMPSPDGWRSWEWPLIHTDLTLEVCFRNMHTNSYPMFD